MNTGKTKLLASNNFMGHPDRDNGRKLGAWADITVVLVQPRCVMTLTVLL